MNNTDQVLNLLPMLDAVYASVSDPGMWDEVSSHLALFFQADAAIVLCASSADDHFIGTGRQVGITCHSNIHSIDKNLIAQSFTACNEHHFSPIQKSSLSSPSKCRRQVQDQDLFNRHIGPSGASSLVTVMLNEHADTAVSSCLSIYRNGSRIRFKNPDRRILTYLLPHMQRAHMLQTTGRRTQCWSSIHANAVENLNTGICQLNAEGKILYLNAKAKNILAKRDGLEIVAGKLIASTEANKVIANQIERVIKGGSGNAIVPRSNSKLAYRLTFQPAVEQTAPHSSHNIPVVLVLIEDSEERSLSAALAMVSNQYRLTPAETRVVRMLAEQDLSPNAIAETLNISIKTVRTQLATVFSKTGAKNQIELVKLIYRS